jgi:hypothetical protein
MQKFSYSCYLLLPRSFISTMFLDTLNLCPSLRMRKRVSHSHNIIINIITWKRKTNFVQSLKSTYSGMQYDSTLCNKLGTH